MIKVLFKVLFKALGHFFTYVIISIVVGLIFTPVVGGIVFLISLLVIANTIKEEFIDEVNDYKSERKRKKIMSDSGMEWGMHRDEDMEDFGFDSMMKSGLKENKDEGK